MHPKYQKQFTPLAIEPNPNIVLNETIGFIGSCFAQNIGKKLSELSYPSFQSPFGVVFNPVSIAKVLQSLDTSEEPWEQTNEGYFSLNHHHLLKNKNLKIAAE